MFTFDEEPLLLNFFFVLVPLVFYHFILTKDHVLQTALRDVLSFLLFGLASVVCMKFPVTVHEGLIFDFRLVPFLLAGFYCRVPVFAALYAVLVGYRFWIGGAGAYLNLISVSSTFLFILLCKPAYRSSSLPVKILVAAGLSFLCKSAALTVNLLLDPGYQMKLGLLIFAIQSLFTGLAVYIVEAIHRNADLRRELMDNERMRVVSVISASVAHEIRNPLTAVRGFIQLLSRNELAEDKRRNYGMICLDELDRAQQIINDYLTLAKPQPEVLEELDIADEVAYVAKVLTSYANLEGVEISTTCAPELAVMGDRSKFRQSIINIAKNGIEAMESLGGNLEITAGKQQGQVMLRIRDNGNGMNKEQISRLGTPYFSTKEKGTGLGTMVSYTIIQSMMGKISVNSEPGKGTEYVILLPHINRVRSG
ncbi:ATP-binding protein [Paenibacillus gansuensis]|uniref:histidine kinase n=1 Tax=Paenibacillus gansuensis TaxID=306542 RepID=A0ABW5P9D6_9BACL